jgi:transposase-like protein
MKPSRPPLCEAAAVRESDAGAGSTIVPPLRDTVLQLIRQLRFAGVPPACVHCGSRTHRWGEFSGRQRYRCVRCQRTFSDLTGTVFRHLKRIDACPVILHCMARRASVRKTARESGISKDTAFRWRHRVLARRAARCAPGCQFSFSDAPGPPFQHSLGLVEFSIIESFKGKRPWPTETLRRHPRYRAVVRGRRIWTRRAWLVSGFGRSGADESPEGGHWLMTRGAARPGSIPLTRFMEDVAGPSTRIGMMAGRHGRWATAARRSSRSLLDLGPWHAFGLGGSGLASDRNSAGILSHLLLAWLEPFRGVSTDRLPSYLAWHLLLTEDANRRITRRTLRASIRTSGGTAGQRLRAWLGETFSLSPGRPLKGTCLLERLLN